MCKHSGGGNKEDAAAVGYCLTTKNWRNLGKKWRFSQNSLKKLAQSLFFCNFAPKFRIYGE
jgi:deoxyribodipyrimidine photolyase